MAVDHYQRFIVTWSRALILPSNNWDISAGNRGEQLVDQGAIDMLNAAADLFDRSVVAVKLSDDRKQTSIDPLDQIVADLGGLPLSEPERIYVFRLIDSCRSAFQESASLARVDLLQRVHELRGVLTMLADTLSQEDDDLRKLGKRLRDTAARVVPYLRFGGQVTAGTVGAAADLLSITSS